MLVPRARLLFWFALIAIPFSVLAALQPGALLPSLVIMAGLVVTVLLDALTALGRLDGLDAELPEVARLSKDRTGALSLKVKNERQTSRNLRVGLPLPRELGPALEEQTVSLPAGHAWSALDWPCTPRQRGRFLLDGARLETASPLGFWSLRATVPVRSEVRVYPNLLGERRQLAGLFLRRGTFGLHARRQVGKGREFEKLREYIPGDGFEDIHWKATAKRGHPVTKVFQIERTQEIYVLLDASRLSGRPAQTPPLVPSSPEPPGLEPAPPPETALERFLTAALVLGLAAEQQADLFGLVTFTDKVDTFVRAKNGKAHYDVCRDALFTVQPRPVTPDFEEVASFIRLRLRRRALLVYFTALDDPVLAENFVRGMDLLCRQHLILVNMIKPADADPLFTRPDVENLDDVYERLGGHLHWHKLRQLDKVLQRRGVRFSLLENENLCAEAVNQYLNVKRRQLI
jgi:uncharacterized protein (DUF58 family)